MKATIWGVEIDPATGMPAVPTGYFWRVKPTNYGYVVQLRHRRRLGSRYIGHQPISMRHDLVTPHKILDAAAYALTCDERISRHFGRSIGVDKSLMGDYPPKTLKHASRDVAP